MNSTRNSLDLHVASVGLLAATALLTALPVAAAPLDGKATRSLTADQTWQVKNMRGPGSSYWAWKSDESVCLRLTDKAGKCDDTGRWKIEGDRLCYELSWWGAANGVKSACVSVSEKAKGSFAAVQDNGLTLFEFSLAK